MRKFKKEGVLDLMFPESFSLDEFRKMDSLEVATKLVAAGKKLDDFLTYKMTHKDYVSNDLAIEFGSSPFETLISQFDSSKKVTGFGDIEFVQVWNKDDVETIYKSRASNITAKMSRVQDVELFAKDLKNLQDKFYILFDYDANSVYEVESVPIYKESWELEAYVISMILSIDSCSSLKELEELKKRMRASKTTYLMKHANDCGNINFSSSNDWTLISTSLKLAFEAKYAALV